MRLEIIIPDSTRPELKAKLARLTQRLSDRPELVEEFDLEDDEIQAMFTPERLDHIDKALADVAAGRFYTAAQVEEHFARKEASWQSQRP
jgi:predicted transcriptional regulator